MTHITIERAKLLQAKSALTDNVGEYRIEGALAILDEILAAQPEQEQAAWKHDCAALLQNDVELWIDRCPHCGKPRTTPPAAQRTWVGLTDEEYLEIIVSHKDPIEFCRDIEQRLKEKNT